MSERLPPAGKIYCTDCGTEVVGKFCWRCGAPTIMLQRDLWPERSASGNSLSLDLHATVASILEDIDWRTGSRVLLALLVAVVLFAVPAIGACAGLVLLFVLARSGRKA